MKKKHLINFLIVTFFYLFSLNLNAEIIKKIEIEGNSRVNNQTIIIYGDIQVNTEADENKLNKILNNLYSTDFFEDFTFTDLKTVLEKTIYYYKNNLGEQI